MKQFDVEYLDLNYLDSAISIRRSRSDDLDPKLGIPSDGSHSEVPAFKSVVRHPSRLPPPAFAEPCSGAMVGAFSTQVDSVPES
jgi:hypothetical protein